jgi:4-amino-4-deoxy-L-arabinose transferase-like glycosyltransferase
VTVDATNGATLDADSAPSRFGYIVTLALLALLVRLACFTGLVASDDAGYACLAQLISAGLYTPEQHLYAIRYGLILPVGVLYWLFGVSEWSTIALPLLASTISSGLIGLIGHRLCGPTAGAIAALLYATFPLQLRYASILVPESVATCYLLAGVLLYVSTGERRQHTFGWLTGMLVGLAYLTKEPALLVAPALLIDAMRWRRWRHAFGIAGGVVAVIAIEHTYYAIATGDLLFRLHVTGMTNNWYLREFLTEESRNLAHRLFKEYPRIMIVPSTDFGIHSLVTLGASAIALVQFRHHRHLYLLVLWPALPWLYLNFGTTDFSNYLLLPVAPRYLDLIYPPLFLLTAWLFATWWKSSSLRPASIAALALVSVVGVGSGLSTRGRGYLADHVGIIRAVVSTALEQGHQCIGLEAQPWLWERWRGVVSILSRGRLGPCTDRTTILLVRNGLGLPSVTEGVGRPSATEGKVSPPEAIGDEQICRIIRPK